jgi:4-azaleucine resistance transporter AzlC
VSEPATNPTRIIPSRAREVAIGLRMSLAAGLGMFPLGVAFGVLVVQAGLPWWMAPALSFGVYAGSVELLLVGMLAGGASLLAVAVTTLLVNFRHVFYAFSFPLRVVRNPLARAYSVYTLTDEAYAVTAATPSSWTAPRLIALQVALQLYWVGGGLGGVLLAGILPGRIEGLEFALCALFVTLTLDAARSRREVPVVLLAGACFGLAAVAVPDSAMFAALVLFSVALVVRFVLTRRGTLHRREGAEDV